MRFTKSDGSLQTRWKFAFSFLAIAILFCVGIIVGHYGIRKDCGDSGSLAMSDEQVRQRMFAEIKPESIRARLKRMTNASHPAGTAANNAVAQYIKESFLADFGAENVKEAKYRVLLSRPNSTHPNSGLISNRDGTAFRELKNKEFPSDAFDGAYFAFAPQGEETSDRLIYANVATEEDFEYLVNNQSLPVNGSIILARYGGFRGDQVEISARYGARAVILFLDPSLVAPHGTNVSLVYPNGPWMPEFAISRGTIYRENGDPLSQSFVSSIGSKEPVYRTAVEDAELPKIPALPIGYGDARVLFELMDQKSIPSDWHVTDSTLPYVLGGVLPEGRRLTVTVTNYLEESEITNVIGTIPGCIEPDRYVIFGNHFDAWTMGGIDPNSGTAAMLELAHSMGILKSREGWCPRRTIIVGAWDAEEYGLIGSTEWVEENLQVLQDRTVAYINIDAAVRGHVAFSAMAMPLLTDVILSATKRVTDPSPMPDGQPLQTMYDAWKKHWRNDSTPRILNLGGGSDYGSFVNMIGVTSADLRYNAEVANPAYHTAYETFDYVEKFVDPTFLYHVAMTQVWGEIVRDLAESAVVPFSVGSFADRMNSSWHRARTELTTMFNLTMEIDLDLMTTAVALFGRNAKSLVEDISKFKTDGRLHNPLLVREMNDRLIKIERMFLEPSGLPGRPLDRHVLQAPSRINSYGSISFAGVMDSAAYTAEGYKENDPAKAAKWLKELKLHFIKVVQIVDRAARFLLAPARTLDQTGAN
ncbi:Glutamate carboxypeptidase 2 [Hypsibius exemplaris]|uniref:Glutamate carboxypeptidase 2 n=1 Tax=Hypsibius exemplaris TaxID=2072580 RepID=A0A9X6N9J7_HYPEX|nr:Glutamate carboxypeptidase 2 [Hypsibius exemplaris]